MIKKRIKILALICLTIAFSSCKEEETITPQSDDTEEETITTQSDFTLTSSAVTDGKLLDAFKCEMKDVNLSENSLPLSWSNIPDGANSLAISMVHYPNSDDITNFNSYLVLWDINTSVSEMAYGVADDGPWFMGADKDGAAISYTSPCSPDAATHAYTITIYALSETPASLPANSSISVTGTVLKEAIATVTTVGTATLEFDSVTL